MALCECVNVTAMTQDVNFRLVEIGQIMVYFFLSELFLIGSIIIINVNCATGNRIFDFVFCESLAVFFGFCRD